MLSKKVQATVNSPRGRYLKRTIKEQEDKLFKARQKINERNKLRAVSLLNEIPNA